MAPTIISLCIAAVSLIFVIITFAVNRNNDTKSDAKEEGKVLNDIKEGLTKAELKLDMLTNMVNEMRAEVKAMNTKVQDIDKELTIVKRDLKTAFNRLDELSERIGDKR